MKTSLKRRDYHKYLWSREELVIAIAKTIFVVGFLAYFFYRSILAILPLSVVGILYFRMLTRRKRDGCREELNMQFKECILSVSASLKAGYAVENAFLESLSDMELLYGQHSLIYQELEMIRRGLVINITLEEQLQDLAVRSDSEEIAQFAEVFSIAKRSGGNLPEIIEASSERIGQRLDAKQEMKTMLSGRQMEQNIMKLMPFGVLFYIGISYPGYFDLLYHNWQGAAIMSGCLAIYLAAYALGDRILEKVAGQMT